MEGNRQVAFLPFGDLYGQNVLLAGTSPPTQASLSQRSADLGAVVPGVNGSYRAVAIDPASELRAVYLFLDDRPEPHPLIGGEVLRAEFRSLRVTPFHRTTWDTGPVPGADVVNPPPLNNQRLALRLWTEEPLSTQLLLPDTTQLIQRLLTTQNTGMSADTLIYYVHAPGARSITFFAGNHNAGSSPAVAAQPVAIYGSRPERSLDDALGLNVGDTTFSGVIATLSVPIGSTFASTRTTIVDPGLTEYYFVAGTTAASTLTYEVGCIIHWNTP